LQCKCVSVRQTERWRRNPTALFLKQVRQFFGTTKVCSENGIIRSRAIIRDRIALIFLIYLPEGFQGTRLKPRVPHGDEMTSVVGVVLMVLSAASLYGQQHAVDATQRYHRLICLVHLTGSGKAGDDPILPEYVPRISDKASRTGIVAWSVQLADDGKMAIIHIVAVDRNAFAPILEDKRPEIKVFEIGKDKKEAIEAEMRKYKKDFSLDAFKVVAQ
jgi:hypothetical protein